MTDIDDDAVTRAMLRIQIPKEIHSHFLRHLYMIGELEKEIERLEKALEEAQPST